MILILGGTTEGRAASQVVDEAGLTYYYSTKGASQSITSAHGIRLMGALDREAMRLFCVNHDIRLLVDAAHPFAVALHGTIEAVSMDLQIPVIRYERRYPPRDERLIWCDNYADAIQKLESKGINRLLALSGVNTIAPLRPYWQAHACYFRILDRDESLAIAAAEGFPAQRLLFFNEGEDERVPLRQLKPQAILTKESGYTGFFIEKVAAAHSLGIDVFVIKRPELPERFHRVYGNDGLRKRIERLLPEFFPLRSGFTTGTCATVAAKAALRALLTREKQHECEITLPSGEPVTLPVSHTEWKEGSATCAVVKDAGDDPDVTNNCTIRATVELLPEDTTDNASENILFRGGEGVGTVTLPGLGLQVGGPAINATPRKMIVDELTPLLPKAMKATVTIAVPGGADIAKRTFNPKLGIVGGISIIGTSGIVRPFSSAAFVASIRKEASVAKAIGCDTLVINSGAKSERFMKELYGELPPQAFVHYGNFIGETLKIGAELGFAKIVLGIMIGKAVKLAEGFLDTHSKKGVMNKNFIQDMARAAGCSQQSVEEIGGLTLARELWDLFEKGERDLFFRQIIDRCESFCRPLLPQTELTVLLISENGEFIYS